MWFQKQRPIRGVKVGGARDNLTERGNVKKKKKNIPCGKKTTVNS